MHPEVARHQKALERLCRQFHVRRLFILDRSNPMRYLEIRARADAKPDPDYTFADKVGKKYGGADLRRMDRPGESRVVVSLHPVKVNAIDLSRR